MREEFEKLPEIVERIKSLEFNNHTKQYESSLMCCSNEAYVNGALYVYQEQQKKIDEVLNLVCKLQYSSGERIYSEVQELLK